MKKLICLLVLMAFTPVFADEQTRTAQQQLKEQGFYYGEADGQLGAETTAAIRRFQIRNGLKVTGTLDAQTIAALSSSDGNSTATPAQEKESAPQPADLRSETSSVVESDRRFLNRQPAPATPAPPVDSAPAPIPAPRTESYSQIFARTPYQTAPEAVQQQTVRRAQIMLYRNGLYEGEIDGIPGPATDRALLLFQAQAGLPATGRLDLSTLAAMRLLPRTQSAPRGFPPDYPERTRPGTYRGIWIR